MGRANLVLRDRSCPTINPQHRHYAHKYLKGRKKRFKFKIVSYIRCEPPQNPKKEIKRITAKVNYDALMPVNTEISYTVDHLPFSTDAKYGPYTREDYDRESLERKSFEAKSLAFGEKMRARQQRAVAKEVRKANAKNIDKTK